MKKTALFFLGLVLLLFPAAIKSSDHADPINLEVLESGITDLFAFPDGDQMIVILNTRRALTAPPAVPTRAFRVRDLHGPSHPSHCRTTPRSARATAVRSPTPKASNPTSR